MKYNKTTWKTGDVITQEKLNHIEDGIGANLDADISNISNLGKSNISGLGMPSTKYIDLTLGGMSTTYTAPANGYIHFNQQLKANMGIWIDVLDSNNNYLYGNSVTSAVDTGASITLPVKKNYKCVVNYTGGKKNYFRFIYAEGDQ